MDSVSVRPRLDRRFDVIQSRYPQLLGTRDTKAEALVLAEWAAKRIAPSRLVVFGEDGGTIVESRDFGAAAANPA